MSTTSISSEERLPLQKKQSDRSVPENFWVWALLLCVGMLMLATISAPENFKANNYGTASVLPPSIIKAIKGLTRVGTLAVLALAILSWGKSDRVTKSLWLMLPAFCFVAFGFLSVMWSPIRSISIMQAASFMTLCLLSMGIGFICHREKDFEILLGGVIGILVLIAFCLLVVYVAKPSCRVLTREASGLFHSTSAGSAMSLGVVLMMLAISTTSWSWARWIFLPSMALFIGVILLCGNRTGLGLAVVLSGLVFACFANRLTVATVAVAGSLAAIAYLCLDPWLYLLNNQLGIVDSIVNQGQSKSEFGTWSGRGEMWEVMWKSYFKSPWIGHGYFVTSERGKLLVWHEWGNWTAHNIYLQTLVTTGIVGGTLLGTHLVRVLIHSCKLAFLPKNSSNRMVGRFAVVIIVWFLCWGFLNSSFVGPLQPESVIYAVIVGIVFASSLNNQQLEDTAEEPQSGLVEGT